MATEIGLPPLDLLDIGGGFSDNPTNWFGEDISMQPNRFPITADLVQNYLQTIFPGANSNVRLMGEPGRQICQEAITLCSQVILKKV